MRVTNVDSLSAYFDRLISEKIKWYFFDKDGKEEEAIDLLNKIIQESSSSNLSVEDWDQVKKAKNILNDL